MTTDTLHFRVLSALLQYPEAELIDALSELDAALANAPTGLRITVAPLLAELAAGDLIAAQEGYVATFDRSRGHSLHLFEHIHGESRERGPALVDLMNAYREHGFEIDANELPDYLPLFLEFLGSVDAATAQDFLNEAVHVIAALAERLGEAESRYACVMNALVALASVKIQPLVAPPIRDMDEMLETFGPGADGTEPLLSQAAGPQTVKFYPRNQEARP
ncbi:nitrate reductase molybdenum cofactor assembly chaperone [Jeongeupia sp. USM3]|uniref:nitrate reductase molybdenum cofactor assembly chaperone n=1 Tax=Jeongeupia sp. USM3 TaxID=1906741 RepID=UPI00089DDFEC|nr:nitrate reductase molybdenum cofactor assembly chaperone [Jeongeupia sp. USM3]AOY01242.1 nitrate reductase molybdenum cofactor assembly chaperone [Jeongeupia sp. USM3]